jgi:hypothetical protein
MAAGCSSVRSVRAVRSVVRCVAAALDGPHPSLRQVPGRKSPLPAGGAALRTQAATSPLPLRLRPGRSKLLGEQYDGTMAPPVHTHASVAKARTPRGQSRGCARDVAGLRLYPQLPHRAQAVRSDRTRCCSTRSIPSISLQQSPRAQIAAAACSSAAVPHSGDTGRWDCDLSAPDSR